MSNINTQNPNPNQDYYEVEVPKDDGSLVAPDLPAQTGLQEIQDIINNLVNNQGDAEESASSIDEPIGPISPISSISPISPIEPIGLISPIGPIKEEPGDKEIDESKNEGTEEVSASKFVIIKDIVENIKNELSRITELLSGAVSKDELEELSKKLTVSKTAKEEASGLKIVEGVFDGEGMVAEDGNKYPVPPNYASKSKLVEGDLLKLTIKQDGSFVYKQIAPIERKRVVGILAHDEGPDQYYVLGEGKKWKVLRASVTYFKGEPGDEVTIVIPRDAPSQWSAVENILKK